MEPCDCCGATEVQEELSNNSEVDFLLVCKSCYALRKTVYKQRR